jgi:hypothetical protein
VDPRKPFHMPISQTPRLSISMVMSGETLFRSAMPTDTPRLREAKTREAGTIRTVYQSRMTYLFKHFFATVWLGGTVL